MSAQTTDVEHPTTTTRWTWIKLARIGGLGFVVWAAALQIGAAFDPLVTLFAIGYLALLRFLDEANRRRIIGFTAFSGLTMAINIVFGSSDFAYPESTGSFVLQLFVTLALVIALAGGAGTLAGWPHARVATVLGAAVVAFAVGLTASLILSMATPSDDPQAGDVAVDAVGFAWQPGVIVFDRQASGGLWIDNRDLGHHIFAVPELGIEIGVPASKARRVEVGEVPLGDYQIICTVPGHEMMTGTLVVGG